MRAVPKLIHRIWFGGPMPDEFVRHGQRWAELHPKWRIMRWGDDTALPPLRNRHLYADAERLYPTDAHRFKADVLRLELLWRFGGVYADADVEPLRPLDSLLHHEVFAGWEPHRGPRGEMAIGQAVLGARPGHDFIKRCIDELPGSVSRHYGKRLAQVTGPWHVTRVYNADPTGVTVLHEDVFYPQSIHQLRDGVTPETPPRALTWHHWNHARGLMEATARRG